MDRGITANGGGRVSILRSWRGSRRKTFRAVGWRLGRYCSAKPDRAQRRGYGYSDECVDDVS